MKENYNKSISLRCGSCGDTSFEFNEDKSWVKCKRCDREYHGGYDELVELNQGEINEQLSEMKKEVSQDLKKDLDKMLKDAFKGNKNIKFK
jgi:ribosomal protein S27E